MLRSYTVLSLLVVLFIGYALGRPSSTEGDVNKGTTQPANAVEEHPIDHMVREVMDEYGANSAGANACVDAQRLWDEELNRNYQATLKLLPKTLQEQLRHAQRAWVAFREAETKFIQMRYQNQYAKDGVMGTMYQAFEQCEIMELTRYRALELAPARFTDPE